MNPDRKTTKSDQNPTVRVGSDTIILLYLLTMAQTLESVIGEALDVWEAVYDKNGIDLYPARLVPDYPEAIPELAQRIATLKRLKARAKLPRNFTLRANRPMVDANNN